MELIEQVKRVIGDVLDIEPEEIDVNADMSTFDEWDSIRNVLVLASIEESFQIKIPKEDVFDLISVDAIVKEIEKIKGIE